MSEQTNSKKGNIILVGAFVAILGVLTIIGRIVPATVLPPPTVSKANTAAGLETTKWLTYEDASGYFSLKYPQEWIVQQLDDPSGGIALRSPSYDAITSGSTKLSGEIYVRAIRNPNDLTPEALFGTFNDASRYWFANYTHADATFGNVHAVYFRSFAEEQTQYSQSLILVVAPTRIISLNYLFTNDNVRDEFETIAATVVVAENIANQR